MAKNTPIEVKKTVKNMLNTSIQALVKLNIGHVFFLLYNKVVKNRRFSFDLRLALHNHKIKANLFFVLPIG